MPILESEALDRLGSASERFRLALNELRREWEPESPPITIAMSTLGQTFTSEIDLFSPLNLQTLLALVESLLRDGDESVKDAVATGFLESLLAESSAGRFSFERIVPNLGPASKKYCREWDKFTGCKTSGLW